MIVDAAGWKQQLAVAADVLERQIETTAWPPDTQLRLERAVMVSAYALRKLSEAEQLSVGFIEQQVPVVVCRSHEPHADIDFDRSTVDLFDRYDMAGGQDRTWALNQLCNRIIHSTIWVACMDAGGFLEGFVVASDYDDGKRVRFVYARHLAEIFRTAAADDGPDNSEYDAMIPCDVLNRDPRSQVTAEQVAEAQRGDGDFVDEAQEDSVAPAAGQAGVPG